MCGNRMQWAVRAVLVCLWVTRCAAGPPVRAGQPRPEASEQFHRLLANVTLDRYMDLISIPQVPSRYTRNDDDQPNLDFQQWAFDDDDEDYVRSYEVTSCPDEQNAVVKYSNLRVQPDPLIFPGTMKISSNIEVLEDVTEPISVQVRMRRRMVYFWMDLPCVASYGSCMYENICDSTIKCPIFYELLGLPCGCPIKKGSYRTEDRSYTVPDVLPSWLTSGDYQVILKASTPNRQLFCVRFKLSVEGPEDPERLLKSYLKKIR